MQPRLNRPASAKSAPPMAMTILLLALCLAQTAGEEADAAQQLALVADCARCGTCARCIVAAPVYVDRPDDERAPTVALLPAGYALFGTGGAPERLSRDQCRLRGLCAYASQRQLVEQYADPASCDPAAAPNATCCDATHGSWFPYAWVPQVGRPCVQDCAGVWGGDAALSSCGVCGGDEPSCAEERERAAAAEEAAATNRAVARRAARERAAAEAAAAELAAAELAAAARAAQELTDRDAAVATVTAAAQELAESRDEAAVAVAAAAAAAQLVETTRVAHEMAAREGAAAAEALETAVAEQRTLVVEREQQATQLARRVEEVQANHEQERAARIASEEAAARGKAEADKTLKAVTEQVKAALAQREEHAELLRQRIEDARQMHQDEKEARLAAEAEVLQLSIEKEKALLAAAEERQRLSAEKDKEIEQLRADASQATIAEKQLSAAASQAIEQAVTEKTLENEATVDEHKLVLAQKELHLAELSQRIEDAHKMHQDEKEARLAAEAEIERQGIGKEKALLAAAQQLQQVEKLSAQAELLTQEKHAAEVRGNALGEQAKALQEAGEAALAAMAIQEEEQLASDEEKDQTIAELLEHVHSFSQARDTEKEARSTAELTLVKLESEKQALLQAHREARKAEQEARVLTDWHLKAIVTERQEAMDALAAAEAAVAQLKEEREQVENEFVGQARRLSNHSSGLADELSKERVARDAAEREAQRAVVAKATAFAAVEEEHAKVVQEKAEQIEELSTRIVSATEAIEAGKVARVASEAEAARVKAEVDQALQDAVVEHTLALVQKDEQIASAALQNLHFWRQREEEIRSEHKAAVSSQEADRESVVADKEKQIKDCQSLIAEFEHRIAESNSTVATLTVQVKILQTEKLAEEAARVLVLAEAEKLREERDKHAAEKVQLAEEHSQERVARFTAQESLQQLSNEKQVAELQHKQEQELLRIEKEARIKELVAQVSIAKTEVEQLKSEATKVVGEKESIAGEHAVERKARLVAEQQAQHLTAERAAAEAKHSEERSSRLSVEEELQRLIDERAAAEANHVQEKQELRSEKEAKLAELSQHMEYISKEKDSEKAARLAAEEMGEKHLADARTERLAHREERDRLNAQDEQIKELLVKLEVLGEEREAAVAANLARVAAEAGAKMLAVEQGLESAITNWAAENDGEVVAALNGLVFRLDSLAESIGMQLTATQLYGMIAVFVGLPMALAYLWARPALQAAELALSASTYRQTLKEMIAARKAREAGGAPDGQAIPVQVAGCLALEMPDFGLFKTDAVGKCLVANVTEVRSIVVTKASYGISWEMDGKTADGDCQAVETALTDIVRAKLLVANPCLSVEKGDDAAMMTAHVRAESYEAAVQMLDDFSTVADAIGESLGQNAVGPRATVRCVFMANAETSSEDSDEAVGALRESVSSAVVAKELWGWIGVEAEESTLVVERLGLRDPHVPSTVAAGPAPVFEFIPQGNLRKGKAGKAGSGAGNSKPSVDGEDEDDETMGGVEWLRGVRHRTVADLAGVGLADPGALCLASELRMDDCAVNALNLSNSEVGLPGLEALAASLQTCETVTALCLVTDSEVFYGQWRARDVEEDPEVARMLSQRAKLLKRIRGSVLRNQQARPQQMRFLETDLQIFSKDFSAAAATAAR